MPRQRLDWTWSPAGDRVVAGAGDVLLCHRTGYSSRCIRLGERLRHADGSRWSHMAWVENHRQVIEALTKGVVRTPLEHYTPIEVVVAKTGLEGEDLAQAQAFAVSCLGKDYGWLTDVGVFLRFCTPGRGLWFGADGCEMCSGLVCQALVRGWFNFSTNPASMSPAEAAENMGVPSSVRELSASSSPSASKTSA